MREFFKPFRRKFGVLTLGLACVFTAGWIRSLTDQDAAVTDRWRSGYVDKHILISELGTITWSRWPAIHTGNPLGWKYLHQKISWTSDDEWTGADIHWRWKWNGFDFCAGSFEEAMWMGKPKPWAREVIVWQIPYWSIVIALTVLSAYLLLRKPRLPAPKTTEPAPATGT